MSQLLQPIADLYRFNSQMISLALADLEPADAFHRLKNGQGSSVAYLVGHLASSRYGVLKTLGAADHNPYRELYGEGAGSRDAEDYPPLAELAAGWRDTAGRFHAALDSLRDEDALRPDDTGFPTPDKTLRGRLAFTAWHETYHLGQIGILRTERGKLSLRQALVAASASQ